MFFCRIGPFFGAECHGLVMNAAVIVQRRALNRHTFSFLPRETRLSTKKQGNPFGSPNRNCEML
jgi:hypothetical protein